MVFGDSEYIQTQKKIVPFKGVALVKGHFRDVASGFKKEELDQYKFIDLDRYRDGYILVSIDKKP